MESRLILFFLAPIFYLIVLPTIKKNQTFRAYNDLNSQENYVDYMLGDWTGSFGKGRYELMIYMHMEKIGNLITGNIKYLIPNEEGEKDTLTSTLNFDVSDKTLVKFIDKENMVLFSSISLNNESIDYLMKGERTSTGSSIVTPKNYIELLNCEKCEFYLKKNKNESEIFEYYKNDFLKTWSQKGSYETSVDSAKRVTQNAKDSITSILADDFFQNIATSQLSIKYNSNDSTFTIKISGCKPLVYPVKISSASEFERVFKNAIEQREVTFKWDNTFHQGYIERFEFKCKKPRYNYAYHLPI